MTAEAVQKYIGEISQRPDEMIVKAINGITKLRDDHVRQRVILEAEHRAHLDELSAKAREEKRTVNDSIQALEKQLSELRDRWAKLNADEQETRQEAIAQWAAQDEAQRKLITAETRMIEDLKS